MSKLRQPPIPMENNDSSASPVFLAALTKWRTARVESRLQGFGIAELQEIEDREQPKSRPYSRRVGRR